MNEFEQQLGSILPAPGKSDPMQIMFLAGQQSTTPANRAGWWKLTSAILTVVCLSLTTYLFLPQQETVGPNVAENNSPEEVRPELANPIVESPRFEERRIEPTLQNPESWRPLGPRARQLETVTGTQVTNEGRSDRGRLSPFAFHREQNQSNF